MIKTVNINARIPVKSVTPPIYGVVKNVKMSSGDILKCLIRRAIVDEVLDDGSTVRLTMKNYFTDNGPVKTDKVDETVVELPAADVKIPEPDPVEVHSVPEAADITAVSVDEKTEEDSTDEVENTESVESEDSNINNSEDSSNDEQNETKTFTSGQNDNQVPARNKKKH